MFVAQNTKKKQKKSLDNEEGMGSKFHEIVHAANAIERAALCLC